MVRRTLLTSFLALLAAGFTSRATADDPKPAEQGETADLSKADICTLKFRMSARNASPEQVKKIVAPYRVVDIHVLEATDVFVQYVVRISCPDGKKGLKEKLLREDLPRGHPDREKVRSLIRGLELLPDNTK